MKRFLKLSASTIFLPALLLFFTASAQSGVSVGPPRVELQGAPGAALTQEVEVINPSAGSALQVTSTLNDVLFQPSGETLYLDPGGHPNSLSSWLTITPLSFVLEPSGNQVVRYTVQVPEGTPDGTYWSVLFFDSETPQQADGPQEGIGITSRVSVGHVIYVDVGQVTRRGEIVGVRYEGGDSGRGIRVNFQNSGNGLVRVQGEIEIRNLAGELVQTLTLEEEAAFPGYAREVAAPFTEPLPPGDYVALAVLDYGEASVAAGEGSFQIP